MDIWIAAVLAAWVPFAAVLAVLVGRTVSRSDAQERLMTRRPRVGDPLPVVLQRQVPAPVVRHVEREHHLAS